MSARIFKPQKVATQSGQAERKPWRLVHDVARARTIDPLMGWTSSDDTRNQLTLAFSTKEEAIAYAERRNIPYELLDEPVHRRRTVSYSDNFRPGRALPWTH